MAWRPRLATPLSAGYDEETHFIRAWEMAHLYFVPNEKLGAQLPFPALYWDLSYRRQPLVEAVEPGFWAKYGSLGLDARDYIYANVETRSVYSPVLLLPQALVLRYLGLKLAPARAAGLLCLPHRGPLVLRAAGMAGGAADSLWKMAARGPRSFAHGGLSGSDHQRRHDLQRHWLLLHWRHACPGRKGAGLDGSNGSACWGCWRCCSRAR